MKPAEVKDKTVNELTALEGKIEGELFQLQFKLGSGQLKQTAEVKKKKKELARVKTFLRQKQLEAK